MDVLAVPSDDSVLFLSSVGMSPLFFPFAFKDKDKKKKHAFHPIEYKFHSEFQSHERGFDRLHSVEIAETINMIRWWKHQTSGVSLLSTNGTGVLLRYLLSARALIAINSADTTVKLWRIVPKRERRGRPNAYVSGGATNETVTDSLPRGRIPQIGRAHV